MVLFAGVVREVGPVNLVSTASTATAMSTVDAFAAVWIKRGGFSPAESSICPRCLPEPCWSVETSEDGRGPPP